MLHEGSMPGAVIYISEFQNKLAWKFDISVSKGHTLCMCIYTMSIHSIYLVSDLEGSDNGDPIYGINRR